MAGNTKKGLDSEAILSKLKGKKVKTGNRHKFAGRNNKKPSRARYWASKRLEKRKIRNLVKYCGLSEAAAYDRWHSTRMGRMR